MPASSKLRNKFHICLYFYNKVYSLLPYPLFSAASYRHVSFLSGSIYRADFL